MFLNVMYQMSMPHMFLITWFETPNVPKMELENYGLIVLLIVWTLIWLKKLKHASETLTSLYHMMSKVLIL